jgi:hypothetical protein
MRLTNHQLLSPESFVPLLLLSSPGYFVVQSEGPLFFVIINHIGYPHIAVLAAMETFALHHPSLWLEQVGGLSFYK